MLITNRTNIITAPNNIYYKAKFIDITANISFGLFIVMFSISKHFHLVSIMAVLILGVELSRF